MTVLFRERNWKSLIKPKMLEVDKESLTSGYGKFVAKPLERGFGLTLGNSLRRVLLSSLQGAAITAVRIKGVVHEFSSVTGVKEDVVDIILNLKELRFKLDSDRATFTIKKSGPGTVTGKDVQLSGNCQVLNPELVLATLDAGSTFEAELIVQLGRGYVTAEQNRLAELPLDFIALDSFFSPVRRVNYTVTQSRVGQRTDYDKLTLEAWTDGSIQPEDALALAAKIIKDQLSVFLNFDDEHEVEVEEKKVTAPEFNPNLYRSVEELELSVRSANCLQNANIKYIYELVQKTENEMLKTKNFGRKSLNEIKEILTEMGLGLGMKLDGFKFPEKGEESKMSSNVEATADESVGEEDEEGSGEEW